VGAVAAPQLKKERRNYRGTRDPLAIVADQKWKKGNALLTLDALTEWLAKRVGLEYLHIDPLKIDFAAVTEVMSSAYATRVRIVDWLWQYAFEQRASDIHIAPRREQGVVRFRIDGVLHQVYQIPAAVLAAMTSRIKILGRMDVVEKRRPQDGRIKTRTLEQADVELRLSTLPTAFGEKIVMRIFDPEVLVRDFRELGFSDDDQK